MKNITKFLVLFSIFLVLIAPSFSYALSLVPCDNTPTIIPGSSTQNADGTITKNTPDIIQYKGSGPCDFNALMKMVNTIIYFILFYMAIPIAAIMFTYAGFELVTSGGSTEKRGTARKVFTNAVIGLTIAVACWLIVKLILSILGYSGAWIGF